MNNIYLDFRGVLKVFVAMPQNEGVANEFELHLTKNLIDEKEPMVQSQTQKEIDDEGGVEGGVTNRRQSPTLFSFPSSPLKTIKHRRLELVLFDKQSSKNTSMKKSFDGHFSELNDKEVVKIIKSMGLGSCLSPRLTNSDESGLRRSKMNAQTRTWRPPWKVFETKMFRFKKDTSRIADEFYPMFKSPLEPSDVLPSWLLNQHTPSVENKFDELIQVRNDSYLSTEESNIIVAAMKDASHDDPEILASVAKFCLILVETMEMHVESIVAAAFHFCLCTSARDESMLSPFASISNFLESYQSHRTVQVENYDEAVANVLNDSMKLKRTEILATIVVLNNAKSAGRTILDLNDSENVRLLLLSEMGDWRALAIRCAACLYRLKRIISNFSAGDDDLNPEAEPRSRAETTLSQELPRAKRDAPLGAEKSQEPPRAKRDAPIRSQEQPPRRCRKRVKQQALPGAERAESQKGRSGRSRVQSISVTRRGRTSRAQDAEPKRDADPTDAECRKATISSARCER